MLYRAISSYLFFLFFLLHKKEVITTFLCYNKIKITNGDKMNNKDILLHIGKTIRTLRTTQGLSQKALGKKCNLAESQIGAYERGQINITISTLSSIIDALGISFITFIETLQTTYFDTSEYKDFKMRYYIETLQDADIEIKLDNDKVILTFNSFQKVLPISEFCTWAENVLNKTNKLTYTVMANSIQAELFNI